MPPGELLSEVFDPKEDEEPVVGAMRSHHKHKNHRIYYLPLTVIKHSQVPSHLFKKHTVDPRVKSCGRHDDLCGVILSSGSCSWLGVVMSIQLIVIEGEGEQIMQWEFRGQCLELFPQP